MSDIESKIEEALSPGAYIPDAGSFAFVALLDAVKAEIDILGSVALGVKTAATLYETFAAACIAKADEVDDSSGSFGEFVESLLLACVEAQQRAGVPANEVVRKLRRWVEKDQYGFCTHLEEKAPTVLDEAGQRELERALTEQLERASGDRAEWKRRSALISLKALAETRQDLEMFVALCEREPLSGRDCLRIARLHERRSELQSSLEWTERGTRLDGRSGASYDLQGLRRELLLRLGRKQEVIDEAWREYETYPSSFRYEALLELLPETEHSACRERALALLAGKSFATVMDVCVATHEQALLVAAVLGSSSEQLESVGHTLAERAAELVVAVAPLAAARILVAQAQRILRAGKSKYYGAAMEYLYRASQCYAACGADEEWAKLAGEIRHEHRRKTFATAFDKLLAGKWPEKKESFLEAAKRSWLEG